MLFMSFMVAKHSSRSLRRCVEMGPTLENLKRNFVPAYLMGCMNADGSRRRDARLMDGSSRSASVMT
jgi:hypothetical protein